MPLPQLANQHSDISSNIKRAVTDTLVGWVANSGVVIRSCSVGYLIEVAAVLQERMVEGAVDADLVEVGTLTRCEVDQVVVAYSFDLRANELAVTHIANPSAGREHVFKAYRVAGDPADAVSVRPRRRVLAELSVAEVADDEDE